jgi:alkyl hydroperoxide reductase subunit AhpC
MKCLAFVIIFTLLSWQLAFAQLQIGDKAYNFVAVNQKGGELFSVNKNVQSKVLFLFSNTSQDLKTNLEHIKKQYKSLLKQNTQIVVITTDAMELTYFSYIHHPNVHKVIYDPNKEITALYQIKESVIGYCVDENKQIKAVLHKKS